MQLPELFDFNKTENKTAKILYKAVLKKNEIE